MFTPVLQKDPNFLEGLGLHGFRTCLVQPSYACQNIVRAAMAVFMAGLFLVSFPAGIVAAAVGGSVLIIIAGIASVLFSIICLFLASHWAYGSFLSCHQPSNG